MFFSFSFLIYMIVFFCHIIISIHVAPLYMH